MILIKLVIICVRNLLKKVRQKGLRNRECDLEQLGCTCVNENSFLELQKSLCFIIASSHLGKLIEAKLRTWEV